MSNETRVFGRMFARELDSKEIESVSGGLRDCDADNFNTTCDKGDGKWVKDDCRV